VCARAVHAASGRPGRFVAVNCGALPEALVESELFGSKKGAFSGATEERAGLVRAADRGTLFLDEIGDLPLEAQPALLRVLQEREVTPVGGAQPVKVDLRVVAATHQDLPARVEEGRFRADLYARLAGFEIVLPALRDRREDVGLLVPVLLRRAAGADAARLSLSGEAGRALVRYAWPANVRELEQCLAAAVALAEGGRIDLAHLPSAVQAAARPGPAPGEEAEEPLSEEDARARDELTAVLRRHGGNLTAAARELGKDRKQIHRWIRRYRIDPDRYRP
jgi:transcriptional regulator with GAF, ATPase, and Fis domain